MSTYRPATSSAPTAGADQETTRSDSGGEGSMPPVIAGLSDPAEIGRGGFGIVYRAHDERFDREVALKVIRDPGLSDEVVARFARECKSLGSLSGHPNIVSIHVAGQTDDGELYLVMEYLPRGSLAQRVTGEGTATAEEALAWGTALAG